MARGSKGKYHKWLEPDNLELLRGWARDGYTDEMLMEQMDISKGTLYDWKKRFPEFSDALKKGKEIVDIEVENALLGRALGYDKWEVKEELIALTQSEYENRLALALDVFDEQNPDATDSERELFKREYPRAELKVTERKLKHYPGDTTAQIFWLKNRKPEIYRDSLHKAQERLLEKKIALFEAGTKDTTLLEALLDVVKEDEK